MLWHNGEWKDDNAALFTASDRLRYGDGVFDTALLIMDDTPRIIHAAAHHARLLHDAGVMGMRPSLPFAVWEQAAHEMVRRNGLERGHYVLNTLISHGPAAGALALPQEPQPQIVMRLRPAPESYPPVEAIISSIRRNEGSPLSQIKSCNYGDNILALNEARSKGANEAIMLNNTGNVACATSSNIFAVIGGTLVTPPLSDGVMAGIIRALLIERLGAEEKSLTPQTLKNAQGIYITNSIRGACVVTSLNENPLPVPAVTINPDFHLQ